MKNRSFTFLLGPMILLILLLGTSGLASATSASIIRVSLSSGGDEPNSGTYYPSVSADGRYVTFISSATNLVSGDTNGTSDVFVRDCETSTTTRVSVDSSGGESNGFSTRATISADGRYVAFESDATNLVAGDTNGLRDIFVHDRTIGTTTRVSVSSSEEQSNSISWYAQISANGGYVVYHSEATNLVAGDTNNQPDVFVRDLAAGTTERVSVSDSEVEGNSLSFYGTLSADGRYVAFSSAASNLVTGDTNNQDDVFVRDRVLGTTIRVSISSTTGEGNSVSGNGACSSISDDGRYIAFISQANNLVAGDTNGRADIFVHDVTTGSTTRVSVNSGGDEGNEMSRNPDISSDGQYVVFESYASNLVTGDTNGTYDIFIHDLSEATTTRVSVTSTGAEGNDGSYNPAFSWDGTVLVFYSGASNLVAGDTNGATDVFLASLIFTEINNYLPLIIR